MNERANERAPASRCQTRDSSDWLAMNLAFDGIIETYKITDVCEFETEL